MAYTLPTDSRMAYDLDGSVVTVFNEQTGVVTSLTNAQLQSLNNEYTDTVTTLSTDIPTDPDTQSFISVIFPEPRNISAYYLGTWEGVYLFYPGYIKTSTDTTNGLDGNWNIVTSQWQRYTDTHRDSYRSSINLLSGVTSIKAIRFEKQYAAALSTQSIDVHSLHLYGKISSNTDRLAFWNPTNNTALVASDLDFGDIKRSFDYTKTFRIKNLSSTLTASNISVTYNSLSNGTPTLTGQLKLSPDGTTFDTSTNIYSLAPLEISDVITIKRSVSSTSLLSVQSARLVASASSWA